MGDTFSKGIDAASSIVVGIIKGDMTGGLAGASAPYLAEQIKKYTTTYDKDGKEIVNKEANLIAHAILGGAVAAIQGNSALAGGGGAISAEAAVGYIKDILYGKDTEIKDLTEAQKQNLSNLAQIASGLAVASVGGSVSDVGAAVAGGKNAVENNGLSLSLPTAWDALKMMLRPSDVGASITISAADVLLSKGLSATETDKFLNSLTMEQLQLIRLATVDPMGNENFEDAILKTYDLHYAAYQANSESNKNTQTSVGAQTSSGTASGGASLPPDDDNNRDKDDSKGTPPKTLQTGGNTVNQNIADKLNQQFGTNYHRRDWGRALEDLKKDFDLRGDHHGKILSNGDYMSGTGRIIGNIKDYLP